MELPFFNEENVNAKINEIQSMSPSNREEQVNEIKGNLLVYIQSNFTLSQSYQNVFEDFDEGLNEEMGYAIGNAVQRDNWDLQVVFPPDPLPGQSLKCKDAKDDVSGTYGSSGWEVTKTVSWTWGS